VLCGLTMRQSQGRVEIHLASVGSPEESTGNGDKLQLHLKPVRYGFGGAVESHFYFGFRSVETFKRMEPSQARRTEP